ncbi:MAG: type II toxin-antitoxin system PemK/MazF family toxin [Armatimonadetes bacterium CG_4_10_14_3_um_filter_66_18]|nr:type II toxin-antitoxin system PemK/MazF family toxin [Armatimonadota bacterium]OIP02663.1 MAG: PemK family transcriptional regulator [Armatimonadetes bacterium CG2_30_66_41]PIX42109.1 MAG: type II toxin-antitoxin system PemK/MazF family toxin [Armatimonadetes bacterium CG_4_8_14_3_um_filter_66_20]PIY44653.1 MAG: type II toxin-antitoxin system PemK/MazF family toxin [Armatimonadetes bacterium CG_4_10_14_3_um_filter_66_18]PIZ41629.1 MAG: type II toxin-antitoxin system PemK/MazF family toxin [
MVISQGDILWVNLRPPVGSAPGYARPCVIVQCDPVNRSRIGTVVVSVLTTNVQRAQSPGNVLLNPGEGGLPRQSVVNVSQLVTVDRSQLGEKIGTLSARRVREVWKGLCQILEPRDTV